VFVAPRQPAVAPWTVALSLFGHVGLVVAVVVAEHILPHDPPAPRSGEHLVAEAHAEERHVAERPPHEV
jgi:hypothetical protein